MKPAFYSSQGEERPWGYEELAALVPGVATLKLLSLRKGCKGRLQRHHRKDEAGHVLRGTLIVRYAEDRELRERVLGPGDSFYFPVGCIHQEEAVTDCFLAEVSTPFINDREGMESLFGLEVPEDALPTTRPEDVTEVQAWW